MNNEEKDYAYNEFISLAMDLICADYNEARRYADKLWDIASCFGDINTVFNLQAIVDDAEGRSAKAEQRVAKAEQRVAKAEQRVAKAEQRVAKAEQRADEYVQKMRKAYKTFVYLCRNRQMVQVEKIKYICDCYLDV